MTITIPPLLEMDLAERAARLHRSVDDLVEQALHGYMAVEPELLEEIADWEATGVADLARAEESLPCPSAKSIGPTSLTAAAANSMADGPASSGTTWPSSQRQQS